MDVMAVAAIKGHLLEVQFRVVGTQIYYPPVHGFWRRLEGRESSLILLSVFKQHYFYTKHILCQELIGSDCSNDYVEVRIGGSSEGQLVGKYCSENLPGPVKVASSSIWVKWVKSVALSSMSATWSTYEGKNLIRILQ
jgi:hypothetical protein